MEGHEECLRLKKCYIVKNLGAARLDKNQAEGLRLCWVDEKEAIPKGCSSRKGKKTSLGDCIDLVLQEGCHSCRQGAGEGLVEAKQRERQLLQRSSIAFAGERARAGVTQ